MRTETTTIGRGRAAEMGKNTEKGGRASRNTVGMTEEIDNGLTNNRIMDRWREQEAGRKWR